MTISSRGPNEEVEPGDEASRLRLERALRDKEELLERERRRCAELELTNRAKDRLLALLANDLRAPVHAVLGWTQLLRREVLDRAARERAFATIEQNAQTQATLIAELLDVSRMAADREQLTLAPVDVGELVARAAEDASAGGVELVIHASEGVFVLGDRDRLAKVVATLLANAIASTSAPGRIDVEATADGQDACIVVRDTGRGIEPSALPRVFDLPAEEGALAARSGHGLGLHVARHLVEVHGGAIAAASDGPGRGATFTVRLPLRSASPHAGDLRDVPAEPHEG